MRPDGSSSSSLRSLIAQSLGLESSTGQSAVADVRVVAAQLAVHGTPAEQDAARRALDILAPDSG